MTQQQEANARSMASLGMTAAQLQRQAREDARVAQSEAARAKVAQSLSGISLEGKDALQQLLPLMVDAPDLVAPIMNQIQSQRNFDRQLASQQAAEGRYYSAQQRADQRYQQEMELRREQMNRPQYDPSKGGFVRPDGSFQPLQMPEGYVPPEREPQKSYADVVREGYASASMIPEAQRTPEQQQAIALGQAFGIKPPASGDMELLPLDAGARKEAFELRGQWDEAERVQAALDEFEAGGGKGGTGLLLGNLPATIANRVDPGGTALRGAISQMSSVIMNALSGAAVSEQERKRLEGFLPTSSDDLGTVQRKLEGYKDYLSTKTDSWRKMYGEAKPLEGIQRKPAAQKPAMAPAGGGNVIRYDAQGRRIQ